MLKNLTSKYLVFCDIIELGCILLLCQLKKACLIFPVFKKVKEEKNLNSDYVCLETFGAGKEFDILFHLDQSKAYYLQSHG